MSSRSAGRGLLRSGLLKRFESSAYAFGKPVGRWPTATTLSSISWMRAGRDRRSAAEWAATDTDDLERGRRFETDEQSDLSRPTSTTLTPCVLTLTRDRDILLAFAAEAETVKPELTIRSSSRWSTNSLT